jgi:hypothetical protein
MECSYHIVKITIMATSQNFEEKKDTLIKILSLNPNCVYWL